MRKVDEEIDFIDKNIPKEAIYAAKAYVRDYIGYNDGYEQDIIVIDSKLFSITNAGNDEFGSMIDLEIAYIYCAGSDPEDGIFDAILFRAEKVRAYQSELIESGGRYGSTNAPRTPASFHAIEFSEVTQIELVEQYRTQTDSPQYLEDSFFSLIINDSSYSETVFCLDDIDDDMDLRDLYVKAQKTLSTLSEGSFDPASDSEWWSDLYSIDESNQGMFQRILAWRLSNMAEVIKEIEKQVEMDAQNAAQKIDIGTCFKLENCRYRL